MRLTVCAAALLLLLPAIAEAQARSKIAPPDAAAAALGGMTAAGVGCLVVSCVFVFLFLSLPIMIAFMRGHPDAVAISAVTLLFGWSFVGWGIALVWALKDFTHYQHRGNAINVSVGNVEAPQAQPPVARPAAAPREVRYEDLSGRDPFDFG